METQCLLQHFPEAIVSVIQSYLAAYTVEDSIIATEVHRFTAREEAWVLEACPDNYRFEEIFSNEDWILSPPGTLYYQYVAEGFFDFSTEFNW